MNKIFLIIGLIFCYHLGISQSSVVEFIKAGVGDANNLFQSYLEPYGLALGEGLNNGWYSTAETHHLLGFDVSLNVSAVQIPDVAKTFDLASIGLSENLHIVGSSIAPTVAGEKVSGPQIEAYDDEGNQLASFRSPQGTGLDIVPVPTAQVSLGLLPHTDIIGRYVPELNYTNGDDEIKLGMFGLGIKHNFKEWMPFLENLPFDASLFAGYSEVNAESSLSFEPQDYGVNNVSITFVSANDQSLKINSTTTKFGLVVSKKLAFITIFGSIAQSNCKTTIDLLGKYPVLTAVSAGQYEIREEDALHDPIALNFESSGISTDIGIRVKLAFLTVFGSVNKAEYTSYNGGISLGIR